MRSSLNGLKSTSAVCCFSGVVPSPVHLKDVQNCLSRIQQILLQLKLFWEKVGSLLDTLKDKTFVDEGLIEDLEDMRDEFLTSIKAAGQVT